MLGEVLRIGDRVVINISDENWNWGYRPVPVQKGVKAVVTGFGEITRGRVREYGVTPGVYVNKCWVCLDKTAHPVSSCFMDLADQAEYKRRIAAMGANIFSCGERLRDLPVTAFWEDDIVRITASWRAGQVAKIISINYHYFGKKRNDGSPMPEYIIALADSPGIGAVFSDLSGTYDINESDLELVQRGRVWNYFNGNPVTFVDLKDEITFFTWLGHHKEIPNSATGLYKWTLSEILEAIKQGIADGFRVSNSFSRSAGLDHVVVKFTDRNLGVRVRDATLAGFKVQ